MSDKALTLSVGWFGGGSGIKTHDCPMLSECLNACRITNERCDVSTTQKIPKACPLRNGNVTIQALKDGNPIRA